MGGEPPPAIQHPAVIGLESLRAPVTVVGEVLRCQRVRDWSEDYPVSAEGAQFRIESALLIPSEPGVEVLGFLVAILVGAHLAGVYSCAGFTGAVVGIDVSWGEGLDVNESSLGARGDLIDGVNDLDDDVGIDALENLEHFFRGPDFLKLGEAVGNPREESFAGAGLAVAATHV